MASMIESIHFKTGSSSFPLFLHTSKTLAVLLSAGEENASRAEMKSELSLLFPPDHTNTGWTGMNLPDESGVLIVQKGKKIPQTYRNCGLHSQKQQFTVGNVK